MKSIDEISRNLSANIQTRQITNAMYLLSASEIRRLSGSIAYADRYMHKIRLTIRDIITRSEGVRHSFIRSSSFQAKASAFVVISSDKSLCGAYNVNIVNLALEQIRSAKKAVVMCAGKHGEAMLRSKGVEADMSWDMTQKGISLGSAAMMADNLIDRYLDGDFDEVYLIFTRYRDQLRQYPTCIRLFPLVLEDFSEELVTEQEKKNAEDDAKGDMIFEPSVRSVLETLVNEYGTGILYSALMQSAMSEHVARMNSMQSATKNADKMIASLRLQYNSARQLAITNEISEIAAANETYENGI